MEKAPPGGIKPIRWILIGSVLLLLVLVLLSRSSGAADLEISQVLEMAQAEKISRIVVKGDRLDITTAAGEAFRSRKESSVSVLELFEQRGVSTGAEGVQVEVEEDGAGFLGVLLPFLPLIIFGGLIFFIFSSARGGLGQAMSIGKSRARMIVGARPTVTFDDVAGIEEAKQELAEIVEFLKQPDKFARLGAKIPRGVLLAGPPGTGKTLVSRAVAGEAGVPFFSGSGSEVVEMFVGVGASRVRDLFARARQSSPAILFIDEIDAVGRHRGAGIGGGNDEREQTLIQILVEMDGFDERTNVIVIAATNRPDVLDPALLRPGRFDRRVVLDLPDARGLEAILRVHVSGKPLAPGVDIQTVARQSHGFSGADLANLVNEAAILVAREGTSLIRLEHLEEAVERVIAGPARKSRGVSDREREIVAYHEAGHALVAAQLPEADLVHRVTIVPRGRVGGYTRLLPEEDRALWSRSQFEAMLAVMMGGQAAEELAFGDITTGASNDLQNASRIARKMVTEYGMSASLGPRTFESGGDVEFLGREISQGREHSDAVAEQIDNEIGGILKRARQKASKVLEEQSERLGLLARRLLSEETLEGPELQAILQAPAAGA